MTDAYIQKNLHCYFVHSEYIVVFIFNKREYSVSSMVVWFWGFFDGFVCFIIYELDHVLSVGKESR